MKRSDPNAKQLVSTAVPGVLPRPIAALYWSFYERERRADLSRLSFLLHERLVVTIVVLIDITVRSAR